MQKPNRALVRVTAAIVVLLLARSANAEVSLGEMMRKCLQLESFWALKSTQDTTGSIPNDGSSVCSGYLLAFRGLQGGSSAPIACLPRAVVGRCSFASPNKLLRRRYYPLLSPMPATMWGTGVKELVTTI